ncbi:GNAT superfamily N-acetyltransferase [Rhodopseudomonas julia]|uniref:GNAT superfamily N-acetyltransferase n=1 Tax=Rhodopseudomonas julia TaxID=200617 RepID=A0ABU0C1H9_9BRAD|nr:GNAT family N-acetyltransferase [Rhodopseudomonas julia]MDQ0324375.1 GNAT superfamily N-acetyltransferase [Rhodopseudomonas julia]
MSATAQASVELIDLMPEHIPHAHRLSVQENWPHRPEDWAHLLELGKGRGAVLDGQLVGTANFVPYGDAAGTCNMIIVDPSMRGIGLGRRLMQAALDAAGDRECRLIATDAGRPLYEKLGFAVTGMITQYNGTAVKMDAPGSAEKAVPDDLDALAALDLEAIGMNRRSLLALLLREGDVWVRRHGSVLEGFVVLRKFGRGMLIGPLVARDDAIAQGLLRDGIARSAGGFLRFDLTAAGDGLAAIATEAGLKRISTGLAMTRPGAAPLRRTGPAKVYALASQALC